MVRLVSGPDSRLRPPSLLPSLPRALCVSLPLNLISKAHHVLSLQSPRGRGHQASLPFRTHGRYWVTGLPVPPLLLPVPSHNCIRYHPQNTPPRKTQLFTRRKRGRFLVSVTLVELLLDTFLPSKGSDSQPVRFKRLHPPLNAFPLQKTSSESYFFGPFTSISPLNGTFLLSSAMKLPKTHAAKPFYHPR